MADVALSQQLVRRVRALMRVARRSGLEPGEVAEDALKVFGRPEQTGQLGEALNAAVADVAALCGAPQRLALAALSVPEDRIKAFFAVENAKGFRRRLERERGTLSDSTPIIREDRER